MTKWKWIGLGMLSALLLLAVGCSSGDSQQADASQDKTAQQEAVAGEGLIAPKLEFAEAQVDLGDVARGDVVTHTFILRNVGTAVLHIRRAKGS